MTVWQEDLEETPETEDFAEKIPVVVHFDFDSFNNTYSFDLHYGIGQEFQFELVSTESKKKQTYRPIVLTDKFGHLTIKVPHHIRLLEPAVQLFWRKKVLIDRGLGHQRFTKIVEQLVYPVEKNTSDTFLGDILKKMSNYLNPKITNPQRKWKI